KIKENTVSIFLDLSKAFETVNHTILLDKLALLGVTNNSLLWFTNYNGLESSLLHLQCGLPQGSILGPLVFYSHKDLDTLNNVVNDELDKISTWFKDNKSSLNIKKKTHFLLFGLKSNAMDFSFKIQIDNIPIKNVSCVRFLGVLVDESLYWKPHVKTHFKKALKSFLLNNVTFPYGMYF
uniref:Reverse transcriptase domain-containing protein n=1 Tax=Oryzias sinensis TaxID=183150 RepID=A0A8C8A4C2_9TELE